MEIRKLECFLKVCETGSISGASEQLYISQQGISRIISSLEKELGTVLFIRSRQGVSLTADGLILKNMHPPSAGAVTLCSGNWLLPMNSRSHWLLLRAFFLCTGIFCMNWRRIP